MISIVKLPLNPASATVDEVLDQNKAAHVWSSNKANNVEEVVVLTTIMLFKHKIKLLY